eukprot:scaffold63_cov36-Phaeocystis_antarctica.AAC.1
MPSPGPMPHSCAAVGQPSSGTPPTLKLSEAKVKRPLRNGVFAVALATSSLRFPDSARTEKRARRAVQ